MKHFAIGGMGSSFFVMVPVIMTIFDHIINGSVIESQLSSDRRWIFNCYSIWWFVITLANVYVFIRTTLNNDLVLSNEKSSQRRIPGYWKLNFSFFQQSSYCLGIKEIINSFLTRNDQDLLYFYMGTV